MADLTQKLLDWYDKNGRQMPWRFKGAAPDAYPVWVSEIMLQQTTVGTVIDYFLRWQKHFPDLKTLAKADIDDVLKLWQGLGYYTRAKKMHECAQLLVKEYNGIFPNKRELLLKLPGIGPYTASSICAFAFNLPETVVDGNVIRVIARLYGIIEEVDKDTIYPLAEKLTSLTRSADYASAIMDLGATVCKPQNPSCSECPWNKECKAFILKIQNEIPKIKKPAKRKANGAIFLAFNDKGQILLTKRNKGLLSGLWEFYWNIDEIKPPFAAKWENTGLKVHHVFTHIDFSGNIFIAKNVNISPGEGVFVHVKDLKDYALSTLMKKVLKLAI